MILVVGHTKGGVGKTALATNIAAILAGQGRDVLLIDGDEQGSAAAFAAIRAERQDVVRIATVQLQGRALYQEVPKLASKYDEIVIDVGGRNTDSLRAALIVADAVLVPFQPRSVDLWAAPQMGAIIAEACAARPARPLPAYSVLNATDPQGRDNEDAAATLRAIEGVEHLPVMIGRRKAIPNAFSDGLAVTEQNPKDAKAVNEMLSFVSVLYRQKVYDDDQAASQRKAV